MAINLEREGVALNAAERNKRNANLTKIEDAINEVGAAVPEAQAAKLLAEEAKLQAVASEEKSESVQTQLNEIVVNGDSSIEAAQARVRSDGTVAATLKDRLDDEHQDLTVKLAEKVEKVDFAVTKNEVASKAEKSYVDQKFSIIGSATPRGAYATLSALQTAFPTGNTSIYVVSADGKWYYWNGTAWTAGGVYQSTGIAQGAVSPLNTSFITPFNINLFDKSKARIGGFYNSTSLAWENYNGINQSDFIPAVPGDIVRANGTNTGGYHVVFKNAAGTIFAGQHKTPVNNMITVTVPANAVSISFQVYNSVMDSFMITKNMDLPANYIPFLETGTLDKSIKISKNNLDPSVKTVDEYIQDEGVLVNLFDKTKILKNGFYHSTTLSWENSTAISASEFVAVQPGDIIRFNGNNAGGYHIVYKNAAGTIFNGIYRTPLNGSVAVTVPANAVSLSVMVYNSAIDSFMLVKNKDLPATYIPFKDSLTLSPILNKTINQMIDVKITPAPTVVDPMDNYVANRLLLWEETFAGSELDSTNWQNLNRGDGSGNEQLEFNTSRSKNVRLEDGKLKITAIKEHFNGKTWTSGHVNTKGLKEFLYGRIEAKMKLPKGQGLWPAFWTMGASIDMRTDEYGVMKNYGQSWPDCGEIDILEFVNNNNYYASTLHWNDGTGHTSAGNINSPALDVTKYHVYGMEWTETEVKFMVDGVIFGTFNVEDATVDGVNPFRKPQFLMLNLAVGGSMPGAPDETTPDQASMLVDWVRVYAPVTETAYVNATSITIDEPVLTLNKGDSKIPLVATILPANTSEKTIKWTTSDPSVAVVGGGYVTALEVGTCTITARTINNMVATCEVTVS